MSRFDLKKVLLGALLGLLPVAFCISPAAAAFLDPYWSARVAALGGAYTAIADDAASVFYNPAAAVGVERKQGSFSYVKLFAGLDGVKLSLSQFGYIHPLSEQAVLGIGYGNFTAADLYREDTIVASYARSLKGLFGDAIGEFAIGASGKYLMRGFDLNTRSTADPVFRDGRRSAVPALDLHAYAVPSPKFLPGLALGVTVRSVNRPDIGFQQTERLPLEIIGGLAYRWRNVALPIDISSRNGELNPRMGMEILTHKKRVALRFGGDLYQVGAGFGYTQNITERFSIVLDYAFLWPIQITESAGSHRATLGVKF